MNEKILQINSRLSSVIATIMILCSTIYMCHVVSQPERPNSFDGIGKFFIVIVTIIVYLINLPLIVSAKYTLNYLNGKNSYKICVIFDIIGILLTSLFIFIFVYLDTLDIFVDHYNGDVNTVAKITCSIIVFLLFMFPLIVNIIGIYKEKKGSSHKKIFRNASFLVIGVIGIITINNLLESYMVVNKKIELTEDNTYTYSNFKTELEDRKLIYELPKNKSEVSNGYGITALDSTSKYTHEFSCNLKSERDSTTHSTNSNRKFPLFIYDSYISLIKKHEKTADYYAIGPEDWYITWRIYYINGKIYAAIGDESMYGGSWETSLSKTKYAIVVSEEKDITIYNTKNNCFVKGGGIIDTSSGIQRSGIPTTVDRYNDNCMKIKTVETINAKSLDEIAKELAPQYWKEYNK